MKFRLLLVPLIGLSYSAVAEAHISLQFPAARHAGAPPLKAAPCGDATEQKPATVPPGNTFRPGQTITVKWTETIGHPGHFRIAFLPSGDAFPDPTGYNDIQTSLPVLKDNIFPTTSRAASGTLHQTDIQLPNVTCSSCTLQILQIMTDKMPFSPSASPSNPSADGDDIYHECADIALVADSGGGSDAGAPRDGGRSPDGARPPDSRPPIGGAGGSGGSAGSGGAGGSIGGAGGGAAGSGGSQPGGGSAGRGGSSGTGGAGGSPPSNSSGGFCSIGGNDQRPALWGLLLVTLAGTLGWRSRTRRPRRTK